jgi:cytochrome c-type biogenesis protein
VVYVLLGLSATALGQWLLHYHRVLEQVSGLVVIILGLNLTGIVRLELLNRDWRWSVNRYARPQSPWYALLLGVAFSCGWTACVGPVLASILTLAANTASWHRGAALLAWYALGLALPFWAIALFLSRLRPWLTRVQPYLPAVQILSGLLLVGVGLLLFFGVFSRLSALFSVS